MSRDYIELDRTFFEISKDQEFDEEAHEMLVAYELDKPIKWVDLLKKPRVIILAEAGVGKTSEMKAATERLLGAGKAAFFLRLEHLRSDFENAFDVGDVNGFREWKASDQKAWFFLDSVDEARLTGSKQFEAAIRKFSQQLGDARQRTHIYISCRNWIWQPQRDFDLIKDKLAFSKTDLEEYQEISKLGSASKVAPEEASSVVNAEEPIDPLVYGLRPLSDEQVRIFARSKGIDDLDKFLKEIEKAEVDLFARKPQDLEDLIGFWKTNERIGSRLELMNNSVSRNLEERDPDRSEGLPLSREDAEYGVEKVAAAVTLLKQARIRVPGADNLTEGFDVGSILSDWQPEKVKALLNRPIFDEVIYGTARFHHRTIREFLTARWVHKLLDSGKSPRQIDQLFFAKQYGCEVLVPTMRPVLLWLVLFDSRIRDIAAVIAPEIFFEGGDPSHLPTDFRCNILEHFCEHFKDEDLHRIPYEASAVERFAHIDLGATINVLLKRHSDNQEIVRHLLQMIWRAGIDECAVYALELAMNVFVDRYTRANAIRAVGSAGTEPQIEELLKHFIEGEEEIDYLLLATLVDTFVPNRLTVCSMVSLIGHVGNTDNSDSTYLQISLRNFVKRCPIDQLSDLVSGVLPHLRREPLVERRDFAVSQKNLWLLEHVGDACHRLAEEKHEDTLLPHIIETIALTATAHGHVLPYSPKHKFSDLVQGWQEFNHTLFWYDIAIARGRLSKSEKPLTAWWQVGAFGKYWRFEIQDFDRLLDAIKERPILDDRHVALSMAFDIYRENGRGLERRNKLKNSVKGNEDLMADLHNYLNPPKMSAEERRYRRQEESFKRNQKRRQEVEKRNLEDWKEEICGDIARLRDTSPAENGHIWSMTSHLLWRLEKSEGERDRWARGNWQALTPEFGSDVAEAFRDGAMAYWRVYSPSLRSEMGDDWGSVPYAVIFGLTGLEIEALSRESWPKQLSYNEVQLACRYIFRELNGFPEWFPRLHSSFPEIVEEAILRELEWELSWQGEKDLGYVLHGILWHAEWLQPRMAAPIVRFLKNQSPKHVTTLREALRVVLACELENVDELVEIARDRTKGDEPKDRMALWFVVRFYIDADNALVDLEEHLEDYECGCDATDFAMRFLTALFGQRLDAIASIHTDYNRASILLPLYMLMHRFIRLEEDTVRTSGKPYSPELRDDAQHARSQIFGLLKEIPGKEAFLALQTISEEHPDRNSRHYFLSLAKERAQADADIVPWKFEDIGTFMANAEHHPRNHNDLFNLVVSRLLDLKASLEDGDDSIAAILMKAEFETEHRLFIGNWLRERSRGIYSVPQEEELADAKKPDFRIHGSGLDCPVPIELKIADKWSGPDLFERLENQLCLNYLRDPRSNRGVFLLIHRGDKKRWEHPLSKCFMEFSDLTRILQSHAEEFIAEKPDIHEVIVIGIDLSHRSDRKSEKVIC